MRCGWDANQLTWGVIQSAGALQEEAAHCGLERDLGLQHGFGLEPPAGCRLGSSLTPYPSSTLPYSWQGPTGPPKGSLLGSAPFPRCWGSLLGPLHSLPPPALQCPPPCLRCMNQKPCGMRQRTSVFPKGGSALQSEGKTPSCHLDRGHSSRLTSLASSAAVSTVCGLSCPSFPTAACSPQPCSCI